MFDELFRERGFTVDQLRTLVEVADAGGITALRKRPSNTKSESVICRQLKFLGEFFGGPLTNSTGRGLVLTEVGQEVASGARNFFQGMEDLKLQIKKEPRSVSIGAGDSILHWVVIPQIPKIQHETEHYSFSLCDCQNEEACRRLQEFSLDFALVRKDIVRSPLKMEAVCSLEYGLFVPKQLMPPKPRAGLSTLLAMLKIASQGGGTIFQTQSQSLAKEAGINLKLAIEFETFPEGEKLLRTGQYGVILPLCIQQHVDMNRFVYIALPFLAPASREICLAWNPGMLRMRPQLEKVLRVIVSSCSGAQSIES